jgi:hypothetical protein
MKQYDYEIPDIPPNDRLVREAVRAGIPEAEKYLEHPLRKNVLDILRMMNGLEKKLKELLDK